MGERPENFPNKYVQKNTKGEKNRATSLLRHFSLVQSFSGQLCLSLLAPVSCSCSSVGPVELPAGMQTSFVDRLHLTLSVSTPAVVVVAAGVAAVSSL